jgi:AraC-like DNA-binding protein
MKLKHLSLRKKFLLSYLLVYVLPFLLLGMLFFLMTYSALKSNSEKTYQNLLDNAVEYVDNQVNQLSLLTIQLSRMDWVNDLVETPKQIPIRERFDEETLASYRRQIAAYLDANSFIEEIVIFFNGKNYCVSSGGEGDIEWMLNSCLKIKEANKAEWQRMVDSDNDDYIVSIMNTGVYGQVSSGLIYVQTIDARKSGDGEIHATFIATIRRSVIENYLSSLADKNGFVAWITNRSGRILVGENHMLGLNGVKPQEKNSLLFTAESKLTGLDFHAAAPKQVIFKGAYTAMNIALAVALALGLLGWVLSLKLAGRSYKPIVELMGFLQNRNKELLNGAAVPLDEMDWLKDTIKDLLKQEDALKQRLEKYRPSLIELYLIKLVEGSDPNAQEFLRGLDLVGVCFPNRTFCCGVIVSASERAGRDMLDVASGEASERKIVHYAFAYRNSTVVLFNYNDMAAFESMVKTINYRCNAMKRENLHLCFGSQGQYMAHVRRSYDEAVMAYEYRLLSFGSCVIVYDEVCECDQRYYYPIGQENILTNHLCNGEYQKAVELFNGIVEKNLESSSLSPRALKNFFMDVELTVFKAAMESGLGNLFKLDPQAVNRFDSVHDMSVYIKDIMLCFCKAVNKIEIRRGHAGKEEIAGYLDGNITNPMLSLNAISAHFKMSPSYFSRCFQEQFNGYFLDYVNSRRIEIAKKLIAENRSSIGELSAAVGYGNDVTFRRIFKKYEGVSPTQYKEMLKRKAAAV